MELPRVTIGGKHFIGEVATRGAHCDDCAPPPVDLYDPPVMRPFLLPFEEFQPYLERIWNNPRQTNRRHFRQQCEEELAAYLGVDHIALTASGTAALELALQSLELEGEVITTPFTFVSAAHSLQGCNLRPVFVDIDPATGTLDPGAIEQAISSQTSAILAGHCFGHPCQIQRIAEIADHHALKVVYDGWHASYARYGYERGDLACLGLPATHAFSAFEGGAIVCADAHAKARIARLRDFGFSDAFSGHATGANANMGEFQAAFGLLQLRHADELIAKRGAIVARYAAGLQAVDGVHLFEPEEGWQLNPSYLPMLLDDGLANHREELSSRLLGGGIHARPYFWPLACDHSIYRDLPSAMANLPAARGLSRRILCLPLCPDLPAHHVETAVAIIAHFAAAYR